jgi:transcriptional regulator with XRE-family HTH domain
LSDLELGKALRRWRDEAMVRGYVVAAKAGISQGYISDIETGRRRLNDETASKIAKAFGIAFDEFEQKLVEAAELNRPARRRDVLIQEDAPLFNVNLSGLSGVVPGADALARWFVNNLSKQDAAALVSRFMGEYQAGDESGLAKANGILHILSEQPKS